MPGIPTPYPANLGGNTSAYESRGGKRRKTFRRNRRFTCRNKSIRNKSIRNKSVFGFLNFLRQ